MPELIPIASDHAGFEMKEKLKAALAGMGFSVQDLGTNSEDSTDYPDYGHPLAEKVSKGEVKRGVLLCGSGIGMDITANRHHGVRAAVIWKPELAELARQHNDLNVLVLPARFISEPEAEAILHKFLETPFAGGRHERRVEKIESEDDETTGQGDGAR